MKKIVDQWTSTVGNTVEIDAAGDMRVTGRVVQNAGRRTVMFTQKSGVMQAAPRNNNARQVEEEPLFLEPVPYWAEQDKK